jgi:folylpolyglutamate synthase/dihydropteroate synthase
LYWLLHHHPQYFAPHFAPAASPAVILNEILQRCAGAEVPWPPSLIGRMQRLQVRGRAGSSELICDVSHNPAGIRAFIAYLRELGLTDGDQKKVPGFFACMRDKDVAAMLDELRPFCEPLLLFEFDNERALARSHLPARHADLYVGGDFSKAWHYAQHQWQSLSGPWILCGSVAAVGEVFSYFQAYPRQRSYQPVLRGAVTS